MTDRAMRKRLRMTWSDMQREDERNEVVLGVVLAVLFSVVSGVAFVLLRM